MCKKIDATVSLHFSSCFALVCKKTFASWSDFTWGQRFATKARLQRVLLSCVENMLFRLLLLPCVCLAEIVLYIRSHSSHLSSGSCRYLFRMRKIVLLFSASFPILKEGFNSFSLVDCPALFYAHWLRGNYINNSQLLKIFVGATFQPYVQKSTCVLEKMKCRNSRG